MTDEVKCLSCQDTGWVCEAHPRKAWATSDEEEQRAGYCPCGAPGMPCCECALFMFTASSGLQ